MPEQIYDVDPELLVEFIDESQEMLNDATNLFIVLESQPDNMDAINKIFRTFHSIKGNAAFFNLLKIKTLAHRIEDLMNLVRDRKLRFCESVASVLIAGSDMVTTMLAAVQHHQPELSDAQLFDALIAQISEIVGHAKDTDAYSVCKRMLDEVRQAKATADIDPLTVQAMLVEFEQTLASVMSRFDTDGRNQTQQVNQDQPPSCPQLDFITKTVGEQREGVLDESVSRQILEALTELNDLVDARSKPLVEQALVSYQTLVPIEGFTPLLGDLILKKLRDIKFTQDDETKPRAATPTDVQHDSEPDTRPEERKKADQTAAAGKTMRIAESAIDTFLNYVGEMVVVAEMYDHLHNRLSEEIGGSKTIADLKKNNESFAAFLDNLQDCIFLLRKVPVKTLVQRAHRIVRDVAMAQNKQIEVAVTGDDVIIDKSLIETLESPFVHILRNAADHGIEPPGERKQAGKNPEGSIRIDVTETEEDIFVSIVDDGAGIDKQAVIDKAVAKGLVSPDDAARLTDQQIFGFLFAPGFSTARTVTDVSGRGVGMDVVKQNLDSINGKITVTSEPGNGSTFVLQFPKSVSLKKIMQGFIVAVDSRRYVLPMSVVVEFFVITGDAIRTMPDRGTCIMHNDAVYPFVHLGNILSDNSSAHHCQNGYRGVGVIVETAIQNVVVCVDEVIGTQKVVVKEIDQWAAAQGLISGATILRDEQVAVVIDTDGIFAGDKVPTF